MLVTGVSVPVVAGRHLFDTTMGVIRHTPVALHWLSRCGICVRVTCRDRMVLMVFASAPQVRYSDTRKDEQERGISIKCTPVSLVLQVPASFQRSERI